MHSCNTLDAQTSHKHTQIHKTHHGPDLGETTSFLLIVFFFINHKGYIQMSFCHLGVPKFLKLGFPQLWRPIKFCENLLLRWGLKQNCNPNRDVSNDMWHATCTQVNQGDSWLLVIESQIGTLTPNPSFGYNLYFKYSNGTCEPILDIYIPKDFQWYK
jgi:hypothetical protein